jgi:hypothetical protein
MRLTKSSAAPLGSDVLDQDQPRGGFDGARLVLLDAARPDHEGVAGSEALRALLELELEVSLELEIGWLDRVQQP